jgi:hypothetical protein
VDSLAANYLPAGEDRDEAQALAEWLRRSRTHSLLVLSGLVPRTAVKAVQAWLVANAPSVGIAPNTLPPSLAENIVHSIHGSHICQDFLHDRWCKRSARDVVRDRLAELQAAAPAAVTAAVTAVVAGQDDNTE